MLARLTTLFLLAALLAAAGCSHPGAPDRDSSVVESQTAPEPDTEGAAVQVYVTRTGEKYHLDGCRHLARSKVGPMTVDEAKGRGYDSCAVCGPPE